jgi:N-terminal half of MaoC dehydratase
MSDTPQQLRWPLRLTVEHGKCLEMARAVRATAGEYTDSPRLTAVPTYTAALNHWGFSGADLIDALGLDLRRVLHGSEEFEFPDGPLHEGQDLLGEIRVVSREEKTSSTGRRMTVVSLETEFRHAATGRVAVRVRRNLLEMAPEGAG